MKNIKTYEQYKKGKTIKNWGGEEYLKIRKKRDKIKNIYCMENNIGLLRIKYNEDILEKLKNNLFSSKNI